MTATALALAKSQAIIASFQFADFLPSSISTLRQFRNRSAWQRLRSVLLCYGASLVYTVSAPSRVTEFRPARNLADIWASPNSGDGEPRTNFTTYAIYLAITLSWSTSRRVLSALQIVTSLVHRVLAILAMSTDFSYEGSAQRVLCVAVTLHGRTYSNMLLEVP